MPDLSRLSYDMAADVLRSWLDINEQATAEFDHLPPDVQHAIRCRGADWSTLIPAMVNIDPELREVAYVIVTGAIAALDRLADDGGDLALSHPGATMHGQERPSDEVGATVDEEVRMLRARVDELETTVRQVVLCLRGSGGMFTTLPMSEAAHEAADDARR